MKNITIVGVGKLGLGLALLFENNGYNIMGIDKNSNYVNSLNAKRFRTIEPQYEKLIAEAKNIKFSTNLDDGIEHSDIIYILIQTPNSGGDKFYDHSFLSNLLVDLNSRKLENKHIIIGCTVMPGYIDQIGNLLLEDCNNCTLSYNPEFVAQGDVIDGFKSPDLILIGTHSNYVKDTLIEVYTKTSINNPKFCVLTPIESEIVKISINGFITTKLSFANMIGDICDKNGADKFKVLKSIGADSRIGNKYFKPGYSYGGPCFPRDTRALELFVAQNDLPFQLLSSTTEYNEFHVIFQANQLLKNHINDDTITIEDVSFKQTDTTNIIEESAKLKIAKYLVKKGKKVIIKDVKIILDEVRKEYGNIFSYHEK